MKKIGILSDTHTYISDEIFDFFKNVDEIWHAGDFGNIATANKLAAFKPVRGVYGNIDGTDIRSVFPENQKFMCEKFRVWITHIGGYPNKYDKRVIKDLYLDPPDIFVCGHSHILKVIYDKKMNFLHINPGAFGIYGFHIVRTAIRMDLHEKNATNLEILELPKFSKNKIDKKEES